jgi:lipopolysaccharide/colanic/teichoic acid biosynthesis glycosyltransferase
MKLLTKYIFDWIVAFIAILVFLPILIIPISILLKLTSMMWLPKVGVLY